MAVAVVGTRALSTVAHASIAGHGFTVEFLALNSGTLPDAIVGVVAGVAGGGAVDAGEGGAVRGVVAEEERGGADGCADCGEQGD